MSQRCPQAQGQPAPSDAERTARAAGIPERVDVDAIERELHRLWSSLDGDTTQGSRGTADAHVTRIYTLTLLAVVRNGRPAEVAAVAARLGARYPSRSIILDLSPARAGRLAVEIALNCHAPGSPVRSTVCCEQITVSASGRALTRVPGLVLPLLVPDLPVYVWRPDDLPADSPEADVLRRLAEVADVLIVDSSAMRRPAAGLRTAAAIAGRPFGGLRDLTWGRLTPWRELIVQCFDPAPMRQALEHLDRIRICTEPGSGNDPIAGLLLGGWLAGRLRWEPAGPARREGGVLRALFWRDGGGLELVVEGGAGPVRSFECAAGGAEPCTVSMTRRSGGESAVDIETRVGRGRPHKVAAGFAMADETALVGAELELTGVDQVLRESVEIVLRVMHGLT
ncbi:MAG TPA: glucose-6-phosphate dehydrogenase assembly protein OpcA [bacterium]|nr:glucose-6-phosphate dehydrogenase assembly protein OpcA [bacterium]